MVDRRTFIRFAGVSGVAALVPQLLEACTPPAPAATGAAPPAAGTTPVSSLLPTYIPIANGPKPDFPAGGALYCDGFTRYPANPVKALPAEPPGAGSIVNIFTEAALPLPTPVDQNPAWQAVNKQLNANVQYTIVSAADYPAKLATIMAGNDLPDILSFVTITAGSNTLSFVPGGQQFLQAQAADLTPFLAGDAAKDYPNLAATPTLSWKNAGCAYQGKLYMVPFQRTLAGDVWLKNAGVYDKEIGQDYVPKNADDFKRILQALTRPQENFFGMGGNPGGAGSPALFLTFFSAVFGAPNNWRLESDGRLTSAFETPEYKEATAYVRDLWSAGVFHPDSITTVTRTDFQGGKFAVFIDTFNGWQDSLRQAPKFSPPPDFKLLPLFPAHDGQKLQFFTIGGYGGAIAFKKASSDRIKELLRIVNWMAAPFGSQEDLLLSYGVQGDDYTFDANEILKLTPKSNQDANYVPWKYTAQHPFVFFAPDVPNYGGTASAAEHTVLPSAVADPTFGAVSATATSKGVALANTMNDGLAALVLGRRPLSDYDQIVKDWQTNGGEQIRKEFMDALAIAK
jgi:putative aldouronate transport system substrate-binding protein